MSQLSAIDTNFSLSLTTFCLEETYLVGASIFQIGIGQSMNTEGLSLLTISEQIYKSSPIANLGIL